MKKFLIALLSFTLIFNSTFCREIKLIHKPPFKNGDRLCYLLSLIKAFQEDKNLSSMLLSLGEKELEENGSNSLYLNIAVNYLKENQENLVSQLERIDFNEHDKFQIIFGLSLLKTYYINLERKKKNELSLIGNFDRHKIILNENIVINENTIMSAFLFDNN